MAATAPEHALHHGEDGTRATGSAPRWGWIRSHPLLFVIGGVGPGVAAVLVVRALDGTAGVDALWRALLRWRVPLLWAGVAVGIPIGTRVAAAGVGADVGIVWSWGTADAVIALLVRYLVQAVPEEVGWRWFALPRLQVRTNALVASLILGALWPRRVERGGHGRRR